MLLVGEKGVRVKVGLQLLGHHALQHFAKAWKDCHGTVGCREEWVLCLLGVRVDQRRLEKGGDPPTRDRAVHEASDSGGKHITSFSPENGGEPIHPNRFCRAEVQKTSPDHLDLDWAEGELGAGTWVFLWLR